MTTHDLMLIGLAGLVLLFGGIALGMVIGHRHGHAAGFQEGFWWTRVDTDALLARRKGKRGRAEG